MRFEIEEIETLVKSENPDKQGSAAQKIWTYLDGHKEQFNEVQYLAPLLFEQLQKNLGNQNSWHFMMALGALDYIEAQDIIADQMVNGKDENIRGFAADALSRYPSNPLSENIRELLYNVIETSGSIVERVNAIRAYASGYAGSKNQEVLGVLESFTKKLGHPTIQFTLDYIIGEINSPV